MGSSLSVGTGVSPVLHFSEYPMPWKLKRFGMGHEAGLKLQNGVPNEGSSEKKAEGNSSEELSISFQVGRSDEADGEFETWFPQISVPSNNTNEGSVGGSWRRHSRSSSFSCLSGAAISANATLANTTINNNTIGGILLPGLDSPRTFRSINSFFPGSSSSSGSGSSYGMPGGGLTVVGDPSSLSSSASPPSNAALLEPEVAALYKSRSAGNELSLSAPTRMESVLEPRKLRMAGGAAGEDRVQAVCSEEDGWLYCAVYDGFNGRDAADYLAAHLYECMMRNLRLLEWQQCKDLWDEGCRQSSLGRKIVVSLPNDNDNGSVDDHLRPMSGESAKQDTCETSSPVQINRKGNRTHAYGGVETETEDAIESPSDDSTIGNAEDVGETDGEAFRQSVMVGLKRSVAQIEEDFLDRVEQEMDDRPDLAMVGSCVLALLLHGQNLYTVNLGDSRAVLATRKAPNGDETGPSLTSEKLHAVQLTETHTLDYEPEKIRVINEHPDDSNAVVGSRVKGKLRVTRAFGAGYLKRVKFNDALLGIFRVRDLESPPYVSSKPFVSARQVCEEDCFAVMGSDGLFDFFSNEEVVAHVWQFICENPKGDPAKFMLDQLLIRAAESAGFTVEELKSIPMGTRRRKYHDDVTIVIITFGHTFQTSSASTLTG